jgi:hypothetical protein
VLPRGPFATASVPKLPYVLPLSAKGVPIVAAIVMAEDRGAHQPVRPVAKAAFLIRLSVSIAANVAGAQPTLGGRLIAPWPAVTLLRAEGTSSPTVLSGASQKVPPGTSPKFRHEDDRKFHPEHGGTPRTTHRRRRHLLFASSRQRCWPGTGPDPRRGSSQERYSNSAPSSGALTATLIGSTHDSAAVNLVVNLLSRIPP